MRILALVLAFGLATLLGCSTPSRGPTEMASAELGPATFVGLENCVDCHEAATEAWRGSHHDLAMQPANESTVVADFDDATFTYAGVTSTFYRQGDEFWVRTDGPDGELTDYPIPYTFGIYPLQQFLIEFPGGRLQALNICWDTRSAEEGGQRWFHLYPEGGETGTVLHDDVLHWTGIYQNWNFMCAECHSTNVERGYDVTTDSYDTTWSEIDVSCEACHGPGSTHVTWAKEKEAAEEAGREYRGDPDMGLAVRLKDQNPAEWVFQGPKPHAARTVARTSRMEVESCGRCHARRGTIQDDYHHGHLLSDEYRVSLLEPELYYADGHILDEVYVYGSFLQSKMFAAGVTCSDCHEPHSNKLRGDGNAVCAQCHLASTYETPTHHHHTAGKPGAQCVDCHMTAKTYMVVDPRRDHSFRVPRPDVAATIDAPDACTGCHDDRDAAWAADVVKGWYPDGLSGTPHYGEAIAAARRWDRDWLPGMLGILADHNQPAIVRATAVRLLGRQPNADAIGALRTAFDDEPLVQLAAADALAAMPERQRLELGVPLLEHPLLAVRIAAARQLAALRAQLPQSRRAALDAALTEYREVQAFNQDRPEGWLNLAGLEIELGKTETAEAMLETVIERFPWFVSSYVTLADLYRRTGRDGEAVPLVEDATAANPDDPAGWFALGLARVRTGQGDDAIANFRQAVELAPDEPYYRYVLGVALNSTGSPGQAIGLLGEAYEQFPGYRDITFALATMNRDAGNIDAALGYARRLLEITGPDPNVLNLVNQLEAARNDAG